MNALVCSNCEVQLIPSRNSVQVVQHAEFGPAAIWTADEMECPKCHIKIAAHFSTKPLAEYWENKKFQAALKLTKLKPANVINCHAFVTTS